MSPRRPCHVPQKAKRRRRFVGVDPGIDNAIISHMHVFEAGSKISGLSTLAPESTLVNLNAGPWHGTFLAPNDTKTPGSVNANCKRCLPASP
jgi:hypothetical protein